LEVSSLCHESHFNRYLFLFFLIEQFVFIDTGCGKTTVVQLLSFVLDQKLFSVNCHATTETSDLIGGLRPVRGRDSIKKQIVEKLKELIRSWPYDDMLNDLELEKYISEEKLDSQQSDGSSSRSFELYDVDTMVALAKTISLRRPEISNDGSSEGRTKKRRKVAESSSPADNNSDHSEVSDNEIESIAIEIEELGQRFRALFEWSDGPLVKAMKSGQLMLLDEMSLAEDAVLERLNSVLEPSRLLVLAEKGDDGSSSKGKDNRIIIAHDNFRIFATMNPGGDYGKRELSPALRSRFTEIWVPSVSERSDFEIVLGRSLTLRLEQQTDFQQSGIISRILDYVEWFNSDICGAASSPYASFSLSLRDILSWANFIVEARKSNEKLTIWDALYHGACLMHLDGLGLGSGLASDSSTALKSKAEQRLSNLLGNEKISNAHSIDEPICLQNGKFGVFPYFINIGKSIIPKSNFNMTAPTTSLNAFRVLRAMQLKKPILLEGSPGVGKTSLVDALASASGNKLVRINLSEQTDISDLMGSDLPVENSTNDGPSFEWCDGVLLTAIKEGSWVLLDELNLASQAVLEGLNSCLDHRATMYIPELGKSFDCPSTFRIFAAQNPLGQGGGRKGLPKSFLNRFTKVFIDALTESDLRSIVSSRFSSFSQDFVNQIINFNIDIHHEVVNLGEYGSEGGPWEFNLRDVFRWCELIDAGHSSHGAGARDLYYQRFRNQEDRDRVDKTFQKHFGRSMIAKASPDFEISDSTVRIGETNLSRLNPLDQTLQNETGIRESELLFSRLIQMEAVARCINLRWPCLLVGGSGTGKTAIISSLANLCNATLVEHCLSPSSDVAELVGGFEQSETLSKVIQIIKDLCMLANNVAMIDAFKSIHSKSCLDATVRLQRHVGNWDDPTLVFEDQTESLRKQAKKLSEVLVTMVQENPALSHFETRLNDIKKAIHSQLNEQKANHHKNSGQFVWRDGILVEALLKGHWLLLENANLCPSSVLDRLNSVTERDGFLLLSESGTQEGENSMHAHRIIKPHKNFRIFFTMNAVNGEISRAMRNRCVEISLLASTIQNSFQSSNGSSIITPTFSEIQMVDFFGIMRSARIRSMEVASAVVKTYLNERMKSSEFFEDLPSLRSVFTSVYILSGLLCRGLDPNVSGEKFLQLSFEVDESVIARDFASNIVDKIKLCDATPLPPNLILESVGNESKTVWETRLLRLFTGEKSNVKDSMRTILNVSETNQIEQSTRAFPSSRELICLLSQLFINTKSHQELKQRASILIGLRSQVAYTVKWMASVLGESLTQFGCSKDHPCFHESTLLTWRRLHQLFVENEWIRSLAKRDTVLDSPNDLTVLEASYYIHENLLDRAAVPCSVTGLLYQFFLAIDNWAANVLMSENDSVVTNLLPQLRFVLDERDKFWNLLKTLPLDVDVMNGFSAFNESEFIVQWQWLQKKLPQTEFRASSVEGWQQVDILIEAIDRAIFGGPRPTWSARRIRKKMIQPLVPRQSKHWEALFSLEDLSSGCSLIVDHRFDPFQKQGSPIDLQELMRLCHPGLYITTTEKVQLLAAICTSQLSWTNVQFGESSWIDEIDFSNRLKNVFDKLKDSFEIEVASAKVDLDIQTIDNLIEPKLLDDLRDLSTTTMSKIDGYCSLKTRLLSFFSKVQLSGLAEFWCVHQEVNLCGELSKLLLASTNEKSIRQGLLSLKSGMKSLVNTAISKTIWKVSDMQTFQLLIWALEGKSSEDLSLKTLLRSLLPTILSTSSRHTFTGSFVCPDSVSSLLEMPDMWTDDVIKNDVFDHSVAFDRECDIGNVRLRQSVRTELLLKMIGKQLSLAKAKKPASTKMYTIENAVHRETQSKDILGMLSTHSISPSKARLYAHHYVLFDILIAVKDSFQEHTMDSILSLVENTTALAESSVDEIKSAGNKINNQFFGLFWHTFLFPLLESLHLAWQEDVMTSEYNKQCSRASIYLGLLRLNLLTPCTPLDPGRAPLAKVSLITRHLINIRSRLVANRLHSGFVQGNFSPETPENKSLLDSVDNLSKKRKSQQKKVIERIESAPAFNELFRETRDFLNTALGNASVLELVEKLSVAEAKGNGVEILKRRAQNWQRTSAAFCRRLSTDFSAYQDVTLLIIDSVQMIQDGLFDTMRQEIGTSVKLEQSCADVIDELHQYPMQEDSGSIKVLISAIGIGKFESNSECFKALSIAILSRLFLKEQLVGLEEDEILVCSRLFTGLTYSCNELLGVNQDTSLEEMQEREFREQFPDHRKEFNGILEDKSEELDREDSIEDTNEENSGVTDNPLTDTQIELLYQIYVGIFSSKRTFQIDSVRKIAFHSSYAAAYELQKDSGNADHSLPRSERMGGHVFAMCLSSMPKVTMVRTYSYFRESSKVVDFHNEACPAMALSAAEPLEKLMARTTQLLTAFPGHPILIGLGKVCERINKLNIITTPIGKVMTGLEVILKQAQDWEQHASEKVQIGSPLTAIGRLTSEWRKLELESWDKLIQGRHNRYRNKAQKYWLRLRGILVNDMKPIKEIDLPPHQNTSWACKRRCITPQWVWKGSASIRSKLFDVFDIAHTKNLKELVKALDTFILTSPLGEFEERLKILRTCADESAAGHETIDTKLSWTLQQSRTLYSILRYYNQYLPGLLQKLADLKAPIEEKLKNETKLAKWDNQSYYALAESTEKNQRKLMKILSQFDASLNLNVGIIIQQEGCLGLRSNVEAHDEFCATFPSFASMFPMQGITKEYQFKSSSNTQYSDDLVSVDETFINPPTDGHIWKIAKYARKMKSLSAKNSKNVTASYIREGGDAASSFCGAIFDRIESLRANSTRPMKERALVDLFRELKQNGYTTTKWATPCELKDIEQLFLLPTPKFDGEETSDVAGGILVRGEQYYMKCITEVNALRSETTMLGSKYMSRREMDSMVNLAYSGMHLLTQQRCLVSTLLTENHDLKELILSVQNSKQSLPLFQSKLERILKTFRDKRVFAFESLQQLSLLLESSKIFQSGKSQNDWIRDSISKLKLLCSEPYDKGSKHLHFVTWEMCQEIESGKNQLIKARELVQAIRRECKDLSCLPLDPFDGCLYSIEQALASALESEDLSKHSIQKSMELPLSKSRGFSEKLSSMIERVLVTYQVLNKDINSLDQSEEVSSIDSDSQSNCDVAIWDCHKKFIKSFTNIDLKKLTENLFALIELLRNLHESQSIRRHELDCCVGLVSNTSVLITHLRQIFHSLLEDYLYFYFSTAKLNYVILRLFRSLVAKGYCSDKTAEEDGEGEGDVKGMTFDDDNDGTGMGEGEGKKDVTDQIENEDQLAGLKSDKDDENDPNKQDEPKELNEEEADHGMEMEGDFDGEMYDLPEKPQDENEIEEQEGEELDTEMGEDANRDDEVVDEKMWNDSDDEDDINKDEEKFEEDNGVKGEAIEDAMRTKEDEEEGEKPDDDDGNPSNEDSRENNLDGAPDEGEDQHDDEEINDDTEDRYEDQHNVDVRADEDEEGQEDPDDQMQLDENLELDEKDQESNAEETDVNESEENLENVENASLSDEPEGDDDKPGANDSGDEDIDDIENDKIVNKAEDAMDLENEGENEPEKEEEDKTDDTPIDKSSEEPGIEEVHGIRSKDGTDAIVEDGDDEEDAEGDTNDENEVIGNPSGGKSDGDQVERDGNDGGGYSKDQVNEEDNTKSKESPHDVPNPLKDPGDANKFWHRKLNVIDSNDSPDDHSVKDNEVDDNDVSQNQKDGDFEYSGDQADSTQVLGEATEEEAVEMELPEENEDEKDEDISEGENQNAENEMDTTEQKNTDKSQTRPKNSKSSIDQKDKIDNNDELSKDGSIMDERATEDYESEDGDEDMEVEDEESEDMITGTRVVSDLSKLRVDGNEPKLDTGAQIVQDEYMTKATAAEVEEARSQWLTIQGETQSLSRRLCEKLRLVMEPLVASKLRGDYRTGKRINMKRVIGYIASGYRKDKIWLRRTKPAKRNYRVLLAVDDSESMQRSGAGEMALHAMATVAVGMNQLEIGELGVASFGDDMKLVHPFHMPFTAESGMNVVRNFKFQQQRTRIAMCIESAMEALEDSGDRSSMQLVFLISDGRIERDSRSALKRLIREMVERNILLAMIIVEGKGKTKDSILNMKEVSFEKGKPVVKRFIDDYPFPYYIVLDDVVSLPEVLGDALKQWFEMLTQMQTS
jgi:midasin (ATPase involved in ribosome maturation)